MVDVDEFDEMTQRDGEKSVSMRGLMHKKNQTFCKSSLGPAAYISMKHLDTGKPTSASFSCQLTSNLPYVGLNVGSGGGATSEF